VIIRDNDYGISIDFCDAINISKNVISGNVIAGIVLNNTSTYCNIFDNEISNTDPGSGVIIENGCYGSKIFSNNIEDNINYGLYLNASFGIFYNRIYYNNFNFNGMNAEDDTPNAIGQNLWYHDTTFRGNIWSNYTPALYDIGAKDQDDDGIGDIRYNLTGIANAQDWFPIYDDGHNGSKVVINGALIAGEYGSWGWAAGRTWCTGSGTVNNPYIISGLKINGQLNGSCLYIYNSDDWNQNFIIRDCELYNSSETESPTPAGGIHLWKVENATIIDNTIFNNDGHGIILRSGSMDTEETKNIIIRNNLIENNNGTGIYLNGSYVHENLIDNNTIILSGINGISIFDNAHDTTVSNNTLYDNTEIGIAITDFQPFPPGGHMEWPPPDYLPIWVLDPWDYNDIINNTITRGDTGIGLESSVLVEITGNYITLTESNGIAIKDFNCENLTITDNTIYDNDQYGINFGWDSPSYTANNYILRNNISNNGDTGIFLQQCYDSTFSDNFLEGNSIGIGLAYLNSYNYFTGNLILNNLDRGFAIFDLSCESNRIYDNNFTDNGINGEDLGIGNQWYIDTLELKAGNFWKDYTGNDTNDDGIGDTPYDNIGGFMKPKDYRPVCWDAPVILKIRPIDNDEFPAENPPDYEIQIKQGIGDVFWYEILGTSETTSPYMKLNGNPNEVRAGKIEKHIWDKLLAGTHTIRFYANDSQGAVGKQDVMVTKLNVTDTLSTTPASSSSSSSSDSSDEEEGYPW